MTSDPQDLLALAADLAEAGEAKASALLTEAAFLQQAPATKPPVEYLRREDLPADNRAGPLHQISGQEPTLTGSPSHHEATHPTDAGLAQPSVSAPQEDWDSESSFDDWDAPVSTCEADDWLAEAKDESERPVLQVEVLTDPGNLRSDDLGQFNGNKSVSRLTVSLKPENRTSIQPKWQEA